MILVKNKGVGIEIGRKLEGKDRSRYYDSRSE